MKGVARSGTWRYSTLTLDTFNEAAGMANRGTFLIDVDGVITFAERNGPGEPRDQAAWKRAIAALPG